VESGEESTAECRKDSSPTTLTRVSDERAQGRVFGEVAQEFDRIRPGYPEDLINDVLDYTGADQVRALEVGAGTGKATTAFAGRGVQVTAVEPDEAMAALLAERLADSAAVQIVLSPFEEYVPRTPFGLLYSAQAWHWTDPNLRWQRAAAALAPGGALALFWNYDRITDPALRVRLVAVHSECAPHIMVDEEPADGTDLASYWPGTDLVRLPEFGDLTERIYLWERALTADDYLSYLSTQATYRMLTAAARDQLFAAIGEQLPDKVTLSVETVLYLGRRIG
jgi:SAM-dependent methyltransferase